MFTNKHVVIAMLIAPVLAVLAYFMVDYYVSEKPKQAEPGKTYKLAERPNCRYASGRCELRNGNFKVGLEVEMLPDDALLLKLDANFSLDGVKVAIAETKDASPEPLAMQTKSSDNKNWEVILRRPRSEESRIYLAIAANGSKFYTDAATKFFQTDRKFNRR